jgi:hypothetical protein
MFSPDELNAVVQQAFKVQSDIPAGHKGAFVTVADKDGVKAIIAEKLGGNWVITGSVDHPWSGGLSYGATIQTTW